MTRIQQDTHLAETDPWDVVSQAQGDRGPLVVGYGRVLVARLNGVWLSLLKLRCSNAEDIAR